MKTFLSTHALSLLLLFTGLACEPEDEISPFPEQGPVKDPGEYADFTLHQIPAGSHNSSMNETRLFTGQKLEFLAIFDSSAVYAAADPVNQYDINKLYGFSDCFSSHQKNSARIGWRWCENELQVFAYTYLDGSRDSKLIKSVSLNEPHRCSIQIEDDRYVFTVDENTVEMKRGCNSGGLKYYLYPYFGGDETAPHDVMIRIRE